MPHIEQWLELWEGLGATAADANLFSQLIAQYSGRTRHYHTIQHLDECLAWLPNTCSLAQNPYEVELALWFHDAIYDTKRQDNELKSAEWAKASALTSGLPLPVAERIYDLVMATRHTAQPESTDAKVLVDIDLSILGAPEERFDEYERQVREEYAWVPALLFRRKRRQILEEFVARPRLFNTAFFLESHEAQARLNLKRSLAKLGS